MAQLTPEQTNKHSPDHIIQTAAAYWASEELLSTVEFDLSTVRGARLVEFEGAFD